VALPGAYAPASIALLVIGTLKPSLHDKEVVVEEEHVYYYWLTFVVLVEVAHFECSFN
jgi:hypothetical protein